MEQALKQPDRRVAGVKQVLRAVKGDRAAQVYLCKDADSVLYHQVQAACEEAGVPVSQVDTMEALGKMCLVGVKTAAAAVLK